MPYFKMARSHAYYYHDIGKYCRLLHQALDYDPHLDPADAYPAKKRSYLLMVALFGIEGTERIAIMWRKLRHRLRRR